MPELPRVSGHRLGVVIGSSLADSPFPGADLVVEVPGAGGVRAVELRLDGDTVVLMRHGRTGDVPAHLVDHHAHVAALCAAGCDRVLALGSAGGLHPHLGPGAVVAPDDFLALGTYPTFHTTTAGYRMPGFAPLWRAEVVGAWRDASSTPIHDGGTYAMVRGPRFETRAEIRLLAAYADIVGMTVPAEAVLAGEAGLAYAAVCKVDNLANGVAGHDLEVDEYRTSAAAGAADLGRDLVATVGRLGSH